MGNDSTFTTLGQVPARVKLKFQLVLIYSMLIFVVTLSLVPASTMLSIFVAFGTFSGVSPQWIQSNVWVISNYGHLFTSSVLTALIISRYKKHWLLLFIVILSGLGTIEVIQHYLPTRQASFGDFLYDFAGCLVGIVAVYVFQYVTLILNPLQTEEAED